MALLFALAGLADRAAAASFPVRFVVLAVLRHAEAIAWAFAIELTSAPVARRSGRYAPPCFALTAAPVLVDDGRADSVRLALAFRALALIIAAWARLLLAPPALPPLPRPAALAARAWPGRIWPAAATLPPPDT